MLSAGAGAAAPIAVRLTSNVPRARCRCNTSKRVSPVTSAQPTCCSRHISALSATAPSASRSDHVGLRQRRPQPARQLSRRRQHASRAPAAISSSDGGAFELGISFEHTHYYDGLSRRPPTSPTTSMCLRVIAGRPTPISRSRPASTVGDALRTSFGRCSATATASRSRSSSGCSAAGGGSRRRGFAIPIMSAPKPADAIPGRRSSAGLKYEINENVGATMLAGIREQDIERREQELRQIRRRREPRLRYRLRAAALAGRAASPSCIRCGRSYRASPDIPSAPRNCSAGASAAPDS